MSNVAEIFENFYSDFEAQYSVSLQQSKVVKDIRQCRTAALGARVLECEVCGHTKILYNS